MLRDALKQAVEVAISTLVTTDRLSSAVLDVPVEISDTKGPEHGDYTCNLAMVAAKKAGMNPRALGELLRNALLSGEGSPSSEERAGGGTVGEGVLFEFVEIAGPGFLNLRLKPEAIAAWVPKILAAERFGHLDNPNPQRINVEFVSVNPNGPITIGSGRGAAFGSALSNVLQAAGNVVHREYYINDGVNSEQMRLFAESVKAIVEDRELPDKGYKGEYVKAVALRLLRNRLGDTVYTLWPLVIALIKMIDALEEENHPQYQGLNLVHPGWEEMLDENLLYQLRGKEPKHFPSLRPIYDRAKEAAVFLQEEDLPPRDVHSRATYSLAMAVAQDKFREILEEQSSDPRAQYEVVDLWLRLTQEEFALSPEIADYKNDMIIEEDELERVKEASAYAGKRLKAVLGDTLRDMPVSWYQAVSQQLMIERQRGDLEAFGVHFDTWFSEQSLHDRGIVAERIEGLKTTGVADEEPYRTKLKLGKGGVVEETIREDQPNEDDSEEGSPSSEARAEGETVGEGVATTHQSTLWLRSTKFGDDMDRVLRRRDGRLTYIASDVAYHEDKLSRPENATKLITILGPDHHGYIGRLTAVMAALLRGPEDTPEANALALAEARERLEVVIYQLVRFLKDGKPAPMRKRDGNIYELRDLIDELGKNLVPDGTEDERRTTGRDVARFFYLMRSHDTTMDFDIDLATQQSDENPVFYAQYAHARICSVLRKASEAPSSSPRGAGPSDLGAASGDEGSAEGGDAKTADRNSVGVASQVEGVGGGDETDFRLLAHPRELALVKKILDLPWEVGRIARDYGAHRLTTYAVELARTYHHFYDACRVIQRDQPELTKARLALCEATKIALHATFELLGVSSPEKLERRPEILEP